MAQQLPFDLPARPARGRDAFFVAPSNALAVHQIDNWRAWPTGKLVLCGPQGAGKSHLAEVWAAARGATIQQAAALREEALIDLASAPLVVEDLDAVAGDRDAELLMFHLHNMLAEARQPLLVTMRTPPSESAIVLRDLRSRLEAAALAPLGAPDDALLRAVLLKLFSDRQLNVPADVLSYLVERMDRSFREAQRLVAVIDAEALARKRRLTKRFVGEVLQGRLDKPSGDPA